MRFPLLSAFQATEPCVSGLVKTRAETIKRLKRNKASGLCEKRSSSKAETSTKPLEANDSHHSVCSSSTSLRIETQTRCQIKSSEKRQRTLSARLPHSIKRWIGRYTSVKVSSATVLSGRSTTSAAESCTLWTHHHSMKVKCFFVSTAWILHSMKYYNARVGE